jgi:hypothetical protein
VYNKSNQDQALLGKLMLTAKNVAKEQGLIIIHNYTITIIVIECLPPASSCFGRTPIGLAAGLNPTFEMDNRHIFIVAVHILISYFDF